MLLYIVCISNLSCWHGVSWSNCTFVFTLNGFGIMTVTAWQQQITLQITATNTSTGLVRVPKKQIKPRESDS